MSYISAQETPEALDGASPLPVDRITVRRAPPWRVLLVKRVFDIALAIALLPVAAVACIAVATLNPFLNPGRLFFTQVRIGRGEAPFRIYKLRTMTGSGATTHCASAEAHRITRFGAFLRTRRIDELLQVINILMGQMSFIGPRPEQSNFHTEFAQAIPGYDMRLAVRPGLSGLAQVESGYAVERNIPFARTKLRYDLKYIGNMGLVMEFYVIARTFRVLVTGFGAR